MNEEKYAFGMTQSTWGTLLLVVTLAEVLAYAFSVSICVMAYFIPNF